MSSPLRVPLVLVSHRGPVVHHPDGRVQKSPGGLATALSGVAHNVDSVTWLAAASNDTERDLAGTTLSYGPARLDLLSLDPAVHHGFYRVVANPLLWFLQHGLYDRDELVIDADVRASFAHYHQANATFARRTLELLPPGPAAVMVHDYHFYELPLMIHAERPDVLVTHFTHIPWPSTDAWRQLPPDLRDPLIRGLLGSDVVAFHTRQSARNFLLCAADLLDLTVDLDLMSVSITTPEGTREVRVRYYPISVDVADLMEKAHTPTVDSNVKRLERALDLENRSLILRVDRTDPSKNLVRGFQAFSQLLRENPAMHDKVVMLAFLQPSRQDVPAYAQYLKRVHDAVDEVNDQFSTSSWQPVRLLLAEDFDTALAAYRLCDVLLVNPVADGMNLVAKEMVLINERAGALVLSDHTGAAAELAAFAYTVHPYDIDDTARALHDALTAPLEDRRARLEACANVVRHNDVVRWLDAQLSELNELSGLQAQK